MVPSGHESFCGIRGVSSVLCFGLTCLKDGFAVKKLLTMVALLGFVVVLGCNDAKSSSAAKPATPPVTDKPKDAAKP
jgi:hypothetical protein